MKFKEYFLAFQTFFLTFQTLLIVFEIQVCKIKTLSFET